MSELPIKVKVQDSANQVVYTDAVLINGTATIIVQYLFEGKHSYR